MSDRVKGLLITLAGVLAICPDTLIIRLVDTDPWTQLFWRGLFIGTGICIMTCIIYRSQTVSVIRATGGEGLILATLFCISNIFFVQSVNATSVAHTLVIISTTPLFAALASLILLKEPVQKITLVAMILVSGAVFLLVLGDPQQEVSLIGDIFAVITAMAMAGTFVTARWAKNRDLSPAMALSSFMVALCVSPLVSWDALDKADLGLIAVLALFLTASLMLLMIGPRFIGAPEVSMLMPIEAVVAVYLVWIFIGEEPSVQALVGGIFIIAILTLHSLILVRRKART